jgi:hypothetical protein
MSPFRVNSCFHRLKLKVVKVSSKISVSWAQDDERRRRRRRVRANMLTAFYGRGAGRWQGGNLKGRRWEGVRVAGTSPHRAAGEIH